MPRGAAVIPYRGKRGVVWRIKYADTDGKQIMETVGAERDGVTRKQAEAELRERLVRVERKGYRRPKPLTFSEFGDTWLEEGKRRRRWKPRTVVAYANALERLRPFFGPLRLAAIRPRDVAAYVADASLEYAPATVGLNLSLLHDVFSTAKREELIDSNPAERVERPRLPRRRWRILEPAEIQRIRAAFTDELARLVFLTLVLTGVRRDELRALRWRDVDLVENVLRVRASKSEEGERAIALSPGLAEQLWQHRRTSAFQGDDELVFCHPRRGTRVGHEWFAAEFRAALQAAGIDDYVRPFHDLRHTSLTNGAAGGEGSIALMGRAGHSNMATTKRYLHLAGVVFHDEADALEQRLLGRHKTSDNAGRKFYPSQPTSPDFSEADPPEHAGSGV